MSVTEPWWTSAAALLIASSFAVAQEPAAEAPAIATPSSWLVVSPVDARGRRPFRPDAVFARHLLDPASPPPAEGDEIVGELGTTRTWTRIQVDADWAAHPDGIGWAYASLDSDRERVMLAHLVGASQLIVNGASQAGDLYDLGAPALPILLRKGANGLYVGGVRGRFALQLTEPPSDVIFAVEEATVPDLVAGQPRLVYCSVLVINATSRSMARVNVYAGGGGVFQEDGPLVALPPPLGVHKFPIVLLPEREGEPLAGGTRVRVPLVAREQADGSGAVVARAELVIEVRGQDEARRQTYISGVDGSIQEYSVVPPLQPIGGSHPKPGIVLTLHGAGVDALAQARSYSRKDDLWIVAPSNRRPFGFDWQDWGRRDAYDVLDALIPKVQADPCRIYLTGHSMGGHGTWHLAANDPDRFAAIAPSAGWGSFDSYGGRPDGLLRELWHAADLASSTERLIANLAPLPTYVLHGTADDNVPVAQARQMVEGLRAAGGAPQVHEQEGAGHWWDGEAAPGADCVDWPGIFELFDASRRAVDPDEIQVVVADPAVDPQHFWLHVLQPVRYGEPIQLSVKREADARTVRITTDNARRLAFEWPTDFETRSVVIGEQQLSRDAWPLGCRVPGLLLEVDGAAARWSPFVADPAGQPTSECNSRHGPTPVWTPPDEKHPCRSGPFKRAFDNGFVLVVGTAGSDEEDRVLLDRARFDAATWWYRANGHARILTEAEFLAQVGDGFPFVQFNTILYGNADTNAAWDDLVPPDFPLRVERGAVTLGAGPEPQRWEGDDLLALFVAPRRDNDHALVGAFADTGPTGARLGDVLAVFVSGVGYPDYSVISSRVLSEGDGGVLAAGFFGPCWELVGR